MNDQENLHENENTQGKSEKEIQEEENNPVVELENKVSELNDKYLRLYSDFENFRKRTAKEKLELLTSGNKSLLLTFLPAIDDFERAIESNAKVEDIKLLKEGFQLIYNKLKKTFENEGVKEMKSNGEVFDVEFHEAITKIPVDKKSMKGKVVDTVEKGYFLNDGVLRYAKVVVGS
jgi:molecular chaperone GrpE